MRIVIAVDSFKGSCTSIEAADSIQKGLLNIIPKAEIIKIPVADGGEGTVEAMLAAGGTIYQHIVTDPIGQTVNAAFAILNNGTAVIEMAAASGLPLVPPEKRNPLYTTTYGTGELIIKAVELGCKKIILGIGGSATNDGGIGAASALGIIFKDSQGNVLTCGGECLEKITKIDISQIPIALKNIDIQIACDVDNPLYGQKGAAQVFAPQKGADQEDVQRLDNGLKHYAEVLKTEFGFDAMFKGSGAAGGLAVPLVAFLGASLYSGIDLILQALDIDRHLLGADLVITGEGKLDFQTVFGKVPVGVAKHAKKYNIPVIALVGSIGTGYEAVYDYGIDSVFNIQNAPMTLEDSMKNTKSLLEDSAKRLARLLGLVCKM